MWEAYLDLPSTYYTYIAYTSTLSATPRLKMFAELFTFIPGISTLDSQSCAGFAELFTAAVHSDIVVSYQSSQYQLLR